MILVKEPLETSSTENSGRDWPKSAALSIRATKGFCVACLEKVSGRGTKLRSRSSRPVATTNSDKGERCDEQWTRKSRGCSLTQPTPQPSALCLQIPDNYLANHAHSNVTKHFVVASAPTNTCSDITVCTNLPSFIIP